MIPIYIAFAIALIVKAVVMVILTRRSGFHILKLAAFWVFLMLFWCVLAFAFMIAIGDAAGLFIIFGLIFVTIPVEAIATHLALSSSKIVRNNLKFTKLMAVMYVLIGNLASVCCGGLAIIVSNIGELLCSKFGLMQTFKEIAFV